MNIVPVRCALLLLTICSVWGCANIVPPSGGKKDVTAPRLLSVNPPDSQLNVRVRKIDLRFDEYIVLNNAPAEIQISPLLPVPLTVVSALRHVSIRIPDSLLRDSTTYRISLGRAVQDLHENNPFTGYSYTFSTGGYFDSLAIRGTVVRAATGLPDTSAMVLLYDAGVSDSAVVSRKPLYVEKVNAMGHFSMTGLPPRSFRIYALRDNNTNLVYDGGTEEIAFHGEIVTPAEDTVVRIALRTFQEKGDTDSAAISPLRKSRRAAPAAAPPKEEKDAPFTYQVAADTGDIEKRTQDVTLPLTVTMVRDIAGIDTGRILLSYDSSGTEVEAAITIGTDTSARNKFEIRTTWKPDRVYTVRLLKGFAKDSADIEAMPSRHRFRTKWEDDYARIQVNLPSRYQGNKYLLQITREQDTVWKKPVTDTVVRMGYLREGKYSLVVIVDENGNGQWDTGDLFAKLQPEFVIPYRQELQLRPGWENIIDFEEPAKPETGGDRDRQRTRGRR